MAVGDNVLCDCKRKMIRKSKKEAKKFRRDAYNCHKKIGDIIMKEKNADDYQTNSVLKTVQTRKKCRRRRRKKTLEQIRKEELIRGIDKDNVEIHRYERILGYKKRKSKNMPEVFRAEGLDYLLEVCDSKSPKHDDEEGDDISLNNTERFDDEESENAGSNNGDSCSGTYSSEKDFATKREESSGVDEDSEHERVDIVNLKEDIYGRLVNMDTGKVLPSKLCAKGKLIELEQKAKLLETEDFLKLKKSLRGLINRLNEHTLVSAVKTFSDIFSSRGHNEVKQLFFLEIINMIDVSYRLPDRLITEYALFIALIHTTVSNEASSFFIENYIVKILETIALLPEGKSLENLCVLLAELYNFKVIKAIIIIEVMQRLREQVNDKCLTCFKAFLSYCGSAMRSRDLDALQKCIMETQSFFSQLPETSKSRQLQYTLDEINAIKNANIRKFTNMVDSAMHTHYVNIFRGLTRKVNKEKELPMNVDDILHITERGRWWLVGAAWFPDTPVLQNKAEDKFAGKSLKFDASLLQLAKRAKMNTAIRRDIFCTVMSSTDEVDAFEKLIKLSLKGQQEREIVHICVHCTLRENIYNGYYAAIIDRLCCYHKRFKLTTQYALWDRIKILSQISEMQRKNLALLIVDLVVKRSVGITILKVIEFGAIDKITAKFLRIILSTVLLRSTQQTLLDMFQNVVNSPQHKLFAEGLLIFFHMALKKPRKNIDNELLQSKVEFLESIWHDNSL